MTGNDLTADQVPALRRELVEYERSPHAANMYALMIEAGRQPIRPPGPAGRVGQLLATTEADRLTRADLWHVDGDLADLVDAAYPTMPPFAPRAHDLPGRNGFVTFARPLTSMIRDAIPADRLFAEALDTPTPEGGDVDPADVEAMRSALLAVTTGEVRIVAASWGPVEESALAVHAGGWPAGAVWMSFYSMPVSVQDRSILDSLGADFAAAHRSMMPTLAIDNELVMGWHPDGVDPTPWLINVTTGGTAAWGAAVMTAFLLSRQGNVAEQTDLPVPRPERRRYTRAGLPEPGPVRVLRLRRTVRDRVPQGTGTSGREYRHRWVVRGYWRNTWYPSIKMHRPQWIAPYLAGPPDKPLLGGDKVTQLNAPTAGAKEGSS